MKSSVFAFLAASLTLGLLPAWAQAEEIDIGTESTPLVAPVCPQGVSQANCDIVLTQVTALETLRDGVAYPTRIHKAGEIVSFSIGISAISSDKKTAAQDVTYLDGAYGGPPQAQLTVLRPSGKTANFGWSVAASSGVYKLQRYFGRVAEFPLAQPLPVVPGETLALTVPTWAPVLSFNLDQKKFAYRQSRRANCTNTPSAIQAQLTIGDRAQYRCDYAGTRVEYAAREITSPSPNAAYRRARARAARRMHRAAR
jgi:hypothetical protein